MQLQRVALSPVEPVAQLTSWAPDEEYAAERAEDCAQACISSFLRWASGVWCPVAYLHDIIHDKGLSELTSLDQIVATLAVMETTAERLYPLSGPNLIALVKQTVNEEHGLIVLRWFDHPGNRDGGGVPLLHFTWAFGYTPTLIQQMGPWSGTLFTEDHNTFSDMYAGGCVRILRKRMLGDH